MAPRSTKFIPPQSSGLTACDLVDGRSKLIDLVPPHIDPSEVVARPVSGALKFCLLATGDAEIHARTGPYMEWDCASGDAILRGMGIDVMDLTGNRLRYNSAHLRVTGLRCSRV